ncbi:hypothetical protein CEXT_303741 [Caerostris extrusa]|uniref:Uncharacterized protein n=1 Tax=Caerostris extrusa TaxID=172846 RepID=A0AAV4XTG2_CAEEX|nr:hypothetical protein CEXT_303741 [Caerostris extrusa]
MVDPVPAASPCPPPRQYSSSSAISTRSEDSCLGRYSPSLPSSRSNWGDVALPCHPTEARHHVMKVRRLMQPLRGDLSPLHHLSSHHQHQHMRDEQPARVDFTHTAGLLHRQPHHHQLQQQQYHHPPPQQQQHHHPQQ